jgi:hypothetical protein
MKLKKLFTAALLLTTVVMMSCKGKSAKDMIVNNWKFTNISGGDASQMPDSIKTEILSSATMEFTKDGKFNVTMMGSKTSGTYSVSDDGKTLTTTDEGKTAETAEILEISKDKIVLKNPKDQSTLTLGVK